MKCPGCGATVPPGKAHRCLGFEIWNQGEK